MGSSIPTAPRYWSTRSVISGEVVSSGGSSATPTEEPRLYIGVIGTSTPSAEEAAAASRLGQGLAEAGAIVVCGGRDGVMEAVCRGVRSAGGTSVGLLPGDTRSDANPFVDIALPTGLGELRNGLIVRASDALVAVGGGPGTLSEIGFALRTGVPVVGLGTWDLDHPDIAQAIVKVDDPASAVATVIGVARRRIETWEG